MRSSRVTATVGGRDLPDERVIDFVEVDLDEAPNAIAGERAVGDATADRSRVDVDALGSDTYRYEPAGLGRRTHWFLRGHGKPCTLGGRCDSTVLVHRGEVESLAGQFSNYMDVILCQVAPALGDPTRRPAPRTR